jgi:hypothetical protein
MAVLVEEWCCGGDGAAVCLRVSRMCQARLQRPPVACRARAADACCVKQIQTHSRPISGRACERSTLSRTLRPPANHWLDAGRPRVVNTSVWPMSRDVPGCFAIFRGALSQPSTLNPLLSTPPNKAARHPVALYQVLPLLPRSLRLPVPSSALLLHLRPAAPAPAHVTARPLACLLGLDRIKLPNASPGSRRPPYGRTRRCNTCARPLDP